MTYAELRKFLREHERNCPEEHLTAYITFSNFGPESSLSYTQLSRTYAITSNSKAFRPDMAGYSIFGQCLDGKDFGVRLDRFMAEERGGKTGWVVEDCCIVAFLLTCSNERVHHPPQLYYSRKQASEAMLRMLCREGNMEYETLKADMERLQTELIDGDYGVTKHSAWLNVPKTGNWDWEIWPIRIYGPLHIALGNIPGGAV